MIKLEGRVDVKRLYGKINLVPSSAGSGGPLQAKTAYPSHSEQVIAPDEDYYGLVAVTVKPVPRLPFLSVSVATEYSNAEMLNHIEMDIATDCDCYIEERNPQYYTYNDVRLPEIPAGNEDTPYGVIYQAVSSGYYYLWLSDRACTTKISLGTTYMSNYGTGNYYRYKDGFPDWICMGTSNMGMITLGKGEDITNDLIWASHNVLDANEAVYFKGTSPVLAE